MLRYPGIGRWFNSTVVSDMQRVGQRARGTQRWGCISSSLYERRSGFNIVFRTCQFAASNGKMVASGSLDGTVRLWTEFGELVRVLKGHIGTIWSIAFSPDGAVLTGSGDGTARLWSSAGDQIRVLEGHTGMVFLYGVFYRWHAAVRVSG